MYYAAHHTGHINWGEGLQGGEHEPLDADDEGHRRLQDVEQPG